MKSGGKRKRGPVGSCAAKPCGNLGRYGWRRVLHDDKAGIFRRIHCRVKLFKFAAAGGTPPTKKLHSFGYAPKTSWRQARLPTT
jgi:hypothetical protein